MNINTLLLTLLSGSFFIIGYILTLIIKNKQLLTNLSLGMAFSVLIFLSVFELNAEAMEKFNTYYGNHLISLLLLIGSILLGMGILKLLDKYVPHHDHFEEKKHNHNNHLHHIGLITALSLIIHNVIEGMSIYGLGLNNPSNGLILALGIGLHNLPFGVQISSMLGDSKKKKITLILSLVLSTVLGGVLMSLIGTVNELVLGILIAITLGMIIYIIIFELLTEIKETKNKKNIYIGMIIGLIIMLISHFLE